jgi:uncharacterized membrane protein
MMGRILRGSTTLERTGTKHARIDWIDLAKGLMMFVVILAHTLNVRVDDLLAVREETALE